MIRALYSLVLWLAQPALRRKLRRRAQAEPGYGHAVEERFGHYTQASPAPANTLVWVHAVSLGETRAAAVLVEQLRLALPGMQLLLTHGTATGREQGLALLRPGDVQVWQPWDTPGAVQRFVMHFAPRIGLLMETEIWPNLVARCAAASIPLCLVNARLSEKSLHKTQRLAWLARPAYAALRAVWAQTADDAARLQQLGAPVRGVLGNLKFDATPDASQLQQGRAWRADGARSVVLFAVSREGEEVLLLQEITRMRALAAEAGGARTMTAAVQWLIVPRHPQRFDEVAHLCSAQGLTVSRRSQWQGAPEAADVWLGDSMREMALYYALSDVALLGGSFLPLGGQNLIEAAACGCPVIMGPHTFNFAQAATLAQHSGAAIEVADMRAAVGRALALLQDAGGLRAAREAAQQLTLANQGAAARTAAAVTSLIAR